MKKLFSLDFAKYQRYLEVQNAKEQQSCSYWNTLSEQVFSECIFKLVRYCESYRWSEICCATRYSWKILNKLLLLLIVKSNKFLKKTPVLESHLDKLQTWRSNFLKKRFWHKFFSSKICEIFNSTYFEEHLWFSASVSFGNFIYDA